MGCKWTYFISPIGTCKIHYIIFSHYGLFSLGRRFISSKAGVDLSINSAIYDGIHSLRSTGTFINKALYDPPGKSGFAAKNSAYRLIFHREPSGGLDLRRDSPGLVRIFYILRLAKKNTIFIVHIR